MDSPNQGLTPKQSKVIGCAGMRKRGVGSWQLIGIVLALIVLVIFLIFMFKDPGVIKKMIFKFFG
jgi:uncharacterized membrane protein